MSDVQKWELRRESDGVVIYMAHTMAAVPWSWHPTMRPMGRLQWFVDGEPHGDVFEYARRAQDARRD